MTAEKWRTCEIELCSSKEYGNPFIDVDVTAEFIGPGGEKIKLLGYWDGENKWKIRFAPTAEGEWRYTTQASDGNSSLMQSGEIKCIPYSGELDIYKHGFLKVGPQGRYLVYNDNTPFFWLGDTHWTFVTEERFSESNCPKYESQFKACVDKRVNQRFTVYQSNFRDGKDFYAFGRYFEYLIETENGFIPNLELFHTNVEPKMKYIADAGLVNAIGFSWSDAILKCGAERYKLLARYLVARYGAYPIVWTLAGELPGYNPDLCDTITDGWREVALEVERTDGYNNLQSVHLATNRPFPDIYQGEKWYDFAMSQAGHGDFDIHYTMYSEYRKAFPACPLVESEGLYEGVLSGELSTRIITPAMMRRLAYLNMQCGGCGYTYGCNGVWELQWEAGKGGLGWGDMAWWDGLDLPGADQLTILRNFYESIEWYKLRPINFLLDKRKTINEQLALRGQPCFTANDDMSTVVGYFSETTMKFATIHTLAYKSYTARWFDPATGEYTLIDADARPVEGTWSLPRSPMRPGEDKVLVLTANL